jgi:hypothetical protein
MILLTNHGANCPRDIVDGYRSRIASDLTGHRDIRSVAPHFEVRAGKRRWNDRTEKYERRND